MIFATSCAIKFKVLFNCFVFCLPLNFYFLQGNVRIDMYECRWTRETDGVKVTWRDEGEGNVRRNQVVAIQDDVVEGVEKEIVDAIFTR